MREGVVILDSSTSGMRLTSPIQILIQTICFPMLLFYSLSSLDSPAPAPAHRFIRFIRSFALCSVIIIFVFLFESLEVFPMYIIRFQSSALNVSENTFFDFANRFFLFYIRIRALYLRKICNHLFLFYKFAMKICY